MNFLFNPIATVSLACTTGQAPRACHYADPHSTPARQVYYLHSTSKESLGQTVQVSLPRSQTWQVKEERPRQPLSLPAHCLSQRLSHTLGPLALSHGAWLEILALPLHKLPCLQCRRPGFDPLVGKILWRRAWQPTPVFLPGESHGQRSLVGYSHKESDMTEQLTLSLFLPVHSNVTLNKSVNLSGPQHPSIQWGSQQKGCYEGQMS